MQGAALKATDFVYKNGTIRFTKVPRTLTLAVCLQEGAPKPEDVFVGGLPQNPMAIFLEHLPVDVKSKRVKVKLTHLEGWNLKIKMQPATYTFIVFTTYRVGNSNLVEDSETHYQIVPDSQDVLRFNVLIRSIATARCAANDPKQLQALPQKKALRGQDKILLLQQATTESANTSAEPPTITASSSQALVKA